MSLGAALAAMLVVVAVGTLIIVEIADRRREHGLVLVAMLCGASSAVTLFAVIAVWALFVSRC